MVLSHQALPRKAQLVAIVLDALVAPAAQHFKPQLAQLAALPTIKPLAHVVQRAQQLLDHAFLSDLSAAIASSLVTAPEGGSASDAGGVSAAGSKDPLQASELDSDIKTTSVRISTCCSHYMR